jgi:hypothetical protein
MPDQIPIEPGKFSEADRRRVWAPADDPLFTYRVTAYYGDAVKPPRVSGELAEQVGTNDQVTVDDAAGRFTEQRHIDKVLVEERLTDDVAIQGHRAGWRTLRAWTRTDDGWTHS